MDISGKNQGAKIIIAGPCVIEDYFTSAIIAEYLIRQAEKYGFELIFKGSYKKANRTSGKSFSGIDSREALHILKSISGKYQIPVMTDVHETTDVDLVDQYVTHLQVPAFLCRQTELIKACAESGKPTNIKKGQFLSPEACLHVVEKYRSFGGVGDMICERGTTFGYNELIVDATVVPRIKRLTDTKVIIDCTHSLQKPNRSSGTTGGDPSLVSTLMNFAMSTGADGIFVEVHPVPSSSPSDSESILEMERFGPFLHQASRIRDAYHNS